MKKISTYIIEKFKIAKDISVGKASLEAEKYFTCDDFAEKFKLPTWAYDYRQLKNGSKNRLWYAVVNYIYLNGPAKREDIVKKLKPQSNGTYAQFFTELVSSNVLIKGTGKDRGLQFLNTNTNEWRNFVGSSYIS